MKRTVPILMADGSVAWIGAVDSSNAKGPISSEPTGVTSYQVWKIDRTGKHLLAEDPKILPNSIALAGSAVYWTDGGTPRSAPID